MRRKGLLSFVFFLFTFLSFFGHFLSFISIFPFFSLHFFINFFLFFIISFFHISFLSALKTWLEWLQLGIFSIKGSIRNFHLLILSSFYIFFFCLTYLLTYFSFRIPFEEPSSEDIFDMCNKETPETFYIGKLMQATVTRYVRLYVQCTVLYSQLTRSKDFWLDKALISRDEQKLGLIFWMVNLPRKIISGSGYDSWASCLCNQLWLPGVEGLGAGGHYLDSSSGNQERDSIFGLIWDKIGNKTIQQHSRTNLG